MKITIAERLRPFSHTPGTRIVVPGTTTILHCFPTYIATANGSIHLSVTGPVRDFTVMQDLEGGVVKVFGHAKEGYYHLSFSRGESASIFFRVDKVPHEEVVQCNGTLFQQRDALTPCFMPNERLSLGNHKKQDWDLVTRRKDLTEILPAWHRLGLVTPQSQFLSESQIDEGEDSFLALYSSFFRDILAPQREDDLYQGLGLPPLHDPFALLSQGAKMIRNLFVSCDKESITILPSLPPSFHCGRFINLSSGPFGIISFEWTKKQVRRMVFHSTVSAECTFHFQSELKTYRLREGSGEGKSVLTSQKSSFSAGKVYYFDNFQK